MSHCIGLGDNMTNWSNTFKTNYKPFLNIHPSKRYRGILRPLYQRANGFEIIFNELLKNKNQEFYIIETGSTRKPGNWKDGNSGVVFSDFVSHHGGYVNSVDIDMRAVNAANEFIDSKYHHATCSDSVEFLQKLEDKSKIDLFYLDSYDVTWEDDLPSAEHHLKEFKVIEPFLRNGTIVAIDDNTVWLETNKRAGKGRLIFEYLADKNIFPLHDDYQIIYKF